MLILSANVGEGHASAARALAARLEDRPGVEVEIVDGLAGMGRILHHMISAGFEIQLRSAPWMYTLTYGLLMRVAPVRWAAQKILFFLGSRPLTRLINRHNPDVIVSTYPATTVVLGKLRQRRVVDGPVYAAITDLTGLFFWAHPGIDMHFVVYAESFCDVERIAGEGSATHVAPLVNAEFFEHSTRRAARERLGLPTDGRIVVVSGGGWGVGDLEGATDAALSFDDMTVVTLAGRSALVKERLDRVYRDESRVSVIGFTDNVRDLLVAADVLVHSTGGVTVVEAALCGCPSISYGLPVGHVLHNTRAMAEIGITGLAGCTKTLRGELARHLDDEPVVPPTWKTASAADALVVSGAKRVKPQSAWSLAVSQAAVIMVMMALVLNWTLSSDDAFALASRVLPIKPLTTAKAHSSQIGVIIDVPAAQIPIVAAHINARGDHASFAIDNAATSYSEQQASASGNGVVLDFRGGGELGWVRTRHTLKQFRDSTNPNGRLLYVVPNGGLSMGEYVLAKTVHGRAVQPSVDFDVNHTSGGWSPRPGEVVDLAMSSASRAEFAELDRLLDVIKSKSLRSVPISAFVGPKPDAAATAREDAKSIAPTATKTSAATTTAPDSGVSAKCSPASAKASETGTIISTTNTTGATREAGILCNALISLSSPRAPATAVAATHKTNTTHA